MEKQVEERGISEVNSPSKKTKYPKKGMRIGSASGQDRTIQLHFRLTEIEILVRSGLDNVHLNYRKMRRKTGLGHLRRISTGREKNNSTQNQEHSGI